MSFIQINTKQNPAFIDTSAFTSNPTLTQVYANGAVAADQTMLIQAAKGGPVIFKANGAATGHLLEVQDSVPNTLFDITDNNTQIIRSGVADGATAVGTIIDSVNSFTTSGDRTLSIRNTNTEYFGFSNFGPAAFAVASRPTLFGDATSTWLMLSNAVGSAIGYSNNYVGVNTLVAGVTINVAGLSQISFITNEMQPTSDLAFAGGDATHRFNGVFTNVVNGGASATNTTNLTITTGVADGASSVCVLINNTVQLANASASYQQWQNGAGGLQVALRVGGSYPYFTGTTTGMGMFDSGVNNGIAVVSSTIQIVIGGSVPFTFTSSEIQPIDLAKTSGDSTHRWNQTWSKQYDGVSQTLGFSATPAFDPTAGETIHIGTITGNVTGATMVSGNVGQQCTVVFLKDNTAGTYTLVFSGANVRTAGTITMSATANSVSTISFRWDDRLPTPAWVETSRTNGI